MNPLETAMAELRVEYLRGARERLALMRERLGQAEGDADPSAARDLLRHFHGLAGSGGSYGLHRVSELGRAGENACRTILDGGDRAAGAAACRRLLADLDAEIETAGGGPSGAPDPSLAPPADARPFDVLVVDDDPQIHGLLRRALEGEGLSVRTASSLAEGLREIERSTPDGVLVDVGLPDGVGYDLIERLRALPGGEHAAGLVISGEGEFVDRVDAIHCGADGYFSKPIDFEALLRRLQFLLDRKRVAPARILYVEDEKDQAAFVRTVLESAGFQVSVCSSAEQFPAEFAAARPDLVLMDVNLPGASGYDIARYLRQDERHMALPIVFLTAHNELSARIEAARAGGDDHLVKPVSPGLLLSTVAARVERARFVRSLLERDGLTRLLTLSAFMERARGVLARHARQPERGAGFAMVDIDHFKAVNDRYGHPAGDRVLASLSALLRRRLRQSDTLGRLGGEEFAVLLEDFTEEEAVRLLRRILTEFSESDQTAPDGSAFRVTFSAGVAMAQPGMTLKQWHEAADAALYAAKRGGRRRVEVYREGPAEKA